MSQPMDIMTMGKYAVGALLIIAGVALILVGQPDKGMAVLAIGLVFVGVGAAAVSGTYHYRKGFRTAVKSPV